MDNTMPLTKAGIQYQIAQNNKNIASLKRKYKRHLELVKNYARAFYDGLYSCSIQAIVDFYGDYTPIKYQRKWELGNAFNGKITKIENGYRVTFSYSSKFMTPGSHRSDELAFSRAFNEGVHGNYNVPTTFTPSPWERIQKYANNYKIRRKPEEVNLNVYYE